MDIWRWVNETENELIESGRARLAELIEAIPGAAVNHRHAELDAAVPEALALAREAKNPWLEVFIRHWNLQSRILHRHEVKDYLPEAVRLIEFANREETRECPQSTCVTQDLAGCYSKIDGPGYVPERLSVARETLARIDARWPCFTCISSEYALALIDGGEAEKALTYIDTQSAELDSVGRGSAARHLAGAKIEAYFALGRLEEALHEAKRAKELASDENDRLSHGLDCASALAQLGLEKEALAELVPFERVLPTHSLYQRWTEAVHALGLAGAIPNDYHLDSQLYELSDRLRTNGVVRGVLDIEHRRATLALARGRVETAAACAEAIRADLPKLRAPLGADRALDTLDQTIAAMRETVESAPEPTSPDAAMDALSKDPEIDAALLHAAARRFPHDERLVLLEAAALRTLRRVSVADQLLRDHLAEHPWALGCLMSLGRTLLDRRQSAEVKNLCELTLQSDPPSEVGASAHHLMALAYRQEGDRVAARIHLDRVLALKPGTVAAELLLATIEREDGQLAEALARIDRVIEENPTPGHADWDRMVVATLLDRWDKVRESARRMGMKIEGEGPIDEPWSLCRIEIEEADGEITAHHAIRTGPVSARIIEVARPRAPQHYGDEVVFDAQPRNAPPREGEEKGHTYLFPRVAVRREGGYRSFLIDGVHPGPEALTSLRDVIAALGGVLSVRSDESYELGDPEGEGALIGLFAYLAWPTSRPVIEAHELLLQRSGSFAHPLVWPGLVQELGLEDEIVRQAEIVERYGL